jgi:hypothetical protein
VAGGRLPVEPRRLRKQPQRDNRAGQDCQTPGTGESLVVALASRAAQAPARARAGEVDVTGPLLERSGCAADLTPVMACNGGR